MKESLLLPLTDTPRKPIWRKWKWIGLICFVLALVINPWYPGPLTTLGFLFGIIVLLNLAFHLARYLKNRFFWRVRNRLVSSFVFIGLIPLLLLAGVIFLSGYILLGQLAASHLRTALVNVEHQIESINTDLSEQVTPQGSTENFNAVASKILSNHSAKFPRLAALLLRRRANGSLETLRTVDPYSSLSDLMLIADPKWSQLTLPFQGLVNCRRSVWIGAIRGLPQWEGHMVALLAPFDAQIEDQIKMEKDIYASVARMNSTNVETSRTQVKISMNESEDRRAVQADLDSSNPSLAARRKNDPRRMISWGAPLEGFDLNTGKRRIAGAVILHVPLITLYEAYFVGSEQIGQVMLNLIYVLLAMFVVAELVSLAIGFIINRRVTQSIHDLHQGTLALQKGNLEHRIPVRRHDQLGLLAHSFNQMSSSITQLLEEVTEKKRLEKELEIAREVQASLFPKQLPHPRGMTVYGGCEPAQSVSGDYYDFFLQDESRLHMVIGDISGKGISAALLMANLQAAMRSQLMTFKNGSQARIETGMASLMSELNTQIYHSSPSEKYATLLSLLYDAENRRLYYCNAGHLPPLLLAKGKIQHLLAGGTVLGLFERASYNAASIEVPPGTLILLFTDGITEAVNEADEEFGEARLLAALQESAGGTPEAIYQRITEKVRHWQGNMKQHDDITLIVGKTH